MSFLKNKGLFPSSLFGPILLLLQIFIAEKKSGSDSFSLIFEMLSLIYFSSIPFFIKLYLILLREYPFLKKALDFASE